MGVLDRISRAFSDDERAFDAVEVAATATDVDESKPGAQAGKDGTGSWYNEGVAGGMDVNADLAGRAKYDIYREMRNDPAIRSLAWMFELPARSADWGLIPPKNDPAGDEVAAARADFAAWNFGLEEHEGELDLSWDEWLVQTLTFVEDGAFGEEIVWADPREYTSREGVDLGLLIPIARFAPRSAASVEHIEYDPRTGKIVRIRQDTPGADWINGSKLCWYALGRKGGNWWGESLLRAAYGPWKLKKALMVAAAIGWDRFASGTPHVMHPAGPANERKAEEIGRNIRVHERGWVTTEGIPQRSGGESEWDVEILHGNTSLADPVPLLNFYNREIAVAGLQHFSVLGTSERGSRAVGDVLSDPYYLAVQAIAKTVALARQKQAVRRLYDRNFGPDVPVPQVVVSKIQGKNIAVLAQALADLASAGFTFTDRDTQNDVRDLVDLRHLPDAIAGPARDAIATLPDNVGIAEGTSIVPAVTG